MTARAVPEKPCATCGRRITWRKKWERDWDAVRHCSDACRTRRVRAVDVDLEVAILELLRERKGTASICPSEAARRVGGPSDWESLLDATRSAARRLVARGQLEMTQSGRVVDPSTARGPVRLRRRRGAGPLLDPSIVRP